MENDKKKIIDNAVIGCVSTVLREALENSHNKTGENLFGIYAKNMQEFITNPKGAKVIKTLTDAFWSDNDDVLDKALEKLSEDKSLPSPKAKYEQSLKKKIFTPIRETIRANMQHSKQAVKDQYYRPIIEGCFMTMRGHNTQFENPHEESSPACADGAYLHVLNALEGITTDFTFVGVPAQIQIADCDAGN
jgi:hypothetical protein